MTSVFALPGLSLLALLGWWSGGRDRAALHRLLLAHALLLGGLAASSPFFLHLSGNARVLATWIPPLSWTQGVSVAGEVLKQHVPHVLGAPLSDAVAALLLLLLLFALWAFRRQPLRLGLILLAVALPFAVTAAASLALQEIFILRVHLWVLVPLSVAVALAVAALPWRPVRLAATLALALVQAVGLYGALAVWKRPEWREATRFVAARAGAEDRVLILGEAGMSRALVLFYEPGLEARIVPFMVEAELRAALRAAEGRPVWLVSTPPHDRVPRARAERMLREGRCREQGREFHSLAAVRWLPAGAPQCNRNAPP